MTKLKSTRLEVHFHEQDRASVFLETTATGREEEQSEVVAVVNFAARQLSNLSASTDQTTPNSLADALQLAADTTLSQDAFVYHPVTLIQYPGTPGRKSFVHLVTNDGRVFGSKLKPRGFGFFARGVGYYAPVSCMVVYQHILNQSKRNREFRSVLAHAVLSLVELRAAGALGFGKHLETTVMSVALGYDRAGVSVPE